MLLVHNVIQQGGNMIDLLTDHIYRSLHQWLHITFQCCNLLSQAGLKSSATAS